MVEEQETCIEPPVTTRGLLPALGASAAWWCTSSPRRFGAQRVTGSSRKLRAALSDAANREKRAGLSCELLI